MTVAWERFQRQGVKKEMAVFEAKDHNQTNKAKIMCRLQRLEPFYNIISGWWVEHFTLTLQNIY